MDKQFSTDDVKKVLAKKAKTITDRGDLVRELAAHFDVAYSTMYFKVRKLEKELELDLTSRRGRRPGSGGTGKFALKVAGRGGKVVASGLSASTAKAIASATAENEGGTRLVAQPVTH